VKDVRLEVLESATDWDDAWRHGAFCELGTGDVDLDGFFAELDGYSGWLVVEQDWVPNPDDAGAEQAEAQVRNRRWLASHAGF
jgi:inosose dehydratase